MTGKQLKEHMRQQADRIEQLTSQLATAQDENKRLREAMHELQNRMLTARNQHKIDMENKP